MTNQLDKWKGQFGDEYAERNAITPELIEARTNFWYTLFNSIGTVPEGILEVGAGNGQNIIAITHAINMMTGTHNKNYKTAIFGTEPNEQARSNLETNCPWLNISKKDVFTMDYESSSIELVFTSGVLIHIHPNDLDKAISNIYRISSRWIICMEYFAPSCEEIKYRDNQEMMWRNDFGGVYLDKFKLRVAAYGFAWKRMTRLDNLTWTLFEKVH